MCWELLRKIKNNVFNYEDTSCNTRHAANNENYFKVVHELVMFRNLSGFLKDFPKFVSFVRLIIR